MNTKRGVKVFTTQNNVPFYIDDNGKLFKNSKVIGNSYGLEKTRGAIFSYSNIHDVRTQILMENDGIITTQCSLDSNSFNGENVIIHNKDYSDDEKQVGLYNIEDKSIRWLYNINRFGSNLRNVNVLYFRQSHTILKSLSLLTGEYELEVDLSQYGKIRNILGVVGDELYVWLGHTTLVAVNIHDGSVQWHINTYETYQVGFDYGVHLLAEERKVVLFQTVQYVEIDLQSRKSELLYKTEFNQSWEFSANTVVGNYIYFVGRNYATDELSVGAFSRTSLQVEWYYAAPEWQGSVPDDYEGEAVVLGNAPQVTEDKLYVLENGTGTLYIFEKEET